MPSIFGSRARTPNIEMSAHAAVLDALRKIHEPEQQAEKAGFLQRFRRRDHGSDGRSKFMVRLGTLAATMAGTAGLALGGMASPAYADTAPQAPTLSISSSQSSVNVNGSVTVNVSSISQGSSPVTSNSLVVIDETKDALVVQTRNGNVIQSQLPGEATVTTNTDGSYSVKFNTPDRYGIYAVQWNGYGAGNSNLVQVTVNTSLVSITNQPSGPVQLGPGGGATTFAYSLASGASITSVSVSNPNGATVGSTISGESTAPNGYVSILPYGLVSGNSMPNTIGLQFCSAPLVSSSSEGTVCLFPSGTWNMTINAVSADGQVFSLGVPFQLSQQLTVTAQPNVCSAAPVNTTGFGLGSEVGVINVDTVNKVIEIIASGNPNENLTVKLTAGANVIYCDMTLDGTGNGQMNIVSNDASFQKLNGQNTDLTLINQTAATVVDEGNFAIPSM